MADAQHVSGVSRRKAILTGAGLVAAGAVAGATGGVVTTRLAEGGLLSAAKENPKVPVMVHLRDAPSGQFDVFVGADKVTIIDTDFAAKLVKAADAANLDSSTAEALSEPK
ncbi:MAG TPA: hypothetical protein VFC19_24480 [Candidatus Limnocylindrales bacterium]|nr:hypothetical protein [Candidatus Limnocylindrales bacterium]